MKGDTTDGKCAELESPRLATLTFAIQQLREGRHCALPHTDTSLRIHRYRLQTPAVNQDLKVFNTETMTHIS